MSAALRPATTTGRSIRIGWAASAAIFLARVPAFAQAAAASSGAFLRRTIASGSAFILVRIASISSALGGVLRYSTTFGFRTDVEAWGGREPDDICDVFDLENFPGKRSLEKRPINNVEWALYCDGVAKEDIYDVLETPEGQQRALDDAPVAEAARHFLQKRVDALFAVIGQRRQVSDLEPEFLVLSSNAPFRLRLAAAFELRDQLVARFDQRAFLDVLTGGHGDSG